MRRKGLGENLRQELAGVCIVSPIMMVRVIVAGATCAAVVSLTGCSGSNHSHAAREPGRSATITLPTADVDKIQSALVSSKPAQVATTLSAAVSAAYKARPWKMLPAGSRVTVTGTLTVSGPLATMRATVTGPRPGNWLLFLVLEKEQWLVYGAKKT